MVRVGVFAGSVAAAAVVLGIVGYYAGAMSANPSPTPDPAGSEVDPVVGFVALTPDTTPPVEPDHEVHLFILPREDSPIPEFFFEPTGLFIQPGDTVKFTFDTPDHTITAYHAAHGFAPRVPDGVEPFSSPLVPPGGYWLYTFEDEGVYDVFCGPHQIFGMAMRIVVGSATGPGTTPILVGPPSEEPPFQPFLTAGLVLSDPVLQPENIISYGSVSWDEVSAESKTLFVQLAAE
jgi:plastocyanin